MTDNTENKDIVDTEVTPEIPMEISEEISEELASEVVEAMVSEEAVEAVEPVQESVGNDAESDTEDAEGEEFEEKIVREAKFFEIDKDDEKTEDAAESGDKPGLVLFQISEKPEGNEEKRAEPKDKRKFNPRWMGLLLIPVAAGGIAGGVWYKKHADWYKEHFYPNTRIGNVEVSEMTVDEAEKALDGSLGSYAIHVLQRDLDEVLTAEDVGQHYVLEEDGSRCVQSYMDNQTPYKWLFEKKDEHQYEELTLDYDEEAVEAAIDRLSCVSPEEVIKAEDAYINYDEETHVYSIVPEHAGNQVKRSTISEYVYSCLDQWGTEVTVAETDYPQAKITSEDASMNEFVNEVERYLSAEITLKDRRAEVMIDRDVIIDFLEINEEERTVELIESRVQHYINTVLDNTFDTVGNERTITTDLSGTFTIGGGTYGKIVYTATELPQLIEEISDGAVVTREPNWRQSERSDENDGIGNTYVDVNLSMQKLSYVKNGEEVLQSNIVSGMMSGGRATPTGIYYVALKRTEYTMKKYNAFVHYWMNFYPAVGVGFHDATWRGSFGGTIYKNNGSHGCINMPYDNAKKLYNSIEYGCPVLVHW